MYFEELEKHAIKYFKEKRPINWEWYRQVKEAIEKGASDDEIKAIKDPIDFNKISFSGVDLINAYYNGYWLARQEMGLPKTTDLEK